MVDAAGDVVIETIADDGGIDTVESADTFSLATRVNVENLVLTGTNAINGTGNALANAITGNDNNNTISGGGGNDVLAGGLGADRLTGGAGQDVFDFDLLVESGDTVTDFAKGATGDVLDLSGVLDDIGYAGSDAFKDGVLSHVENEANTFVFIDADGVGGNSATKMATLLNVHLTETNTDNYLL